MKKNKTSKNNSKNNNKGFITIEALLVITLLLVFAFFILNKLLFKLKFVGNDLLSDMDNTFALDTSNAGNGGLGGNNGSGNNNGNGGNGGNGGIDGEGGGNEFPVVPPITSNTMLDIYYDDGKQPWTNQDISILVKTNHTDVTTIMLPTGNVNKDSATFIAKENGPYRIGAKDKYGKEIFEDIRITKIDKVMPLLETTNEGTKDNPKIRITARDADSGIDRIIMPDGEVIVSSNSVIYPINKNGAYIFRVLDRAGNVVAKTIDIVDLDDQAPVIQIKKELDIEKKKMLLTATVTDVGSGVDRLVLPDGTVLRSESATYTVTENGRYTFKAYDRKGNMGQFHVNVVEIEEIIQRNIVDTGISYTGEFAYDRKSNKTYYKGPTKIGSVSIDNFNIATENYTEFMLLKDPVYTDVKKVMTTNTDNIIVFKNNGDVYAKGMNKNAELGLGHKSIEYNFVKLPISNVVDIENTKQGTIVVLGSGEVYVSGIMVGGDLGLGKQSSALVFTKIEEVNNAKNVYTVIDLGRNLELTFLLLDNGKILMSGVMDNYYTINITGYDNGTLKNFHEYINLRNIEKIYHKKYVVNYSNQTASNQLQLFFEEAVTNNIYGINTAYYSNYAQTNKDLSLYNFEDSIKKAIFLYDSIYQYTMLNNGKIMSRTGIDLNAGREEKFKYVDMTHHNYKAQPILKQQNGNYYYADKLTIPVNFIDW